MKRMLLAVLAVLCLLSLAGCRKEPTAEERWSEIMGNTDKETTSRMSDIINSNLP